MKHLDQRGIAILEEQRSREEKINKSQKDQSSRDEKINKSHKEKSSQDEKINKSQQEQSGLYENGVTKKCSTGVRKSSNMIVQGLKILATILSIILFVGENMLLLAIK